MKKWLKENLPKFIISIKEFIKNNGLIIAILILSIAFLFIVSGIKAHFRELYFLKILLYLIVFIAIICLLLLISKKDKRIILGYSLGFFTIIIMILLPVLQNAEIKENRIMAVKDINNLNCAMAVANTTLLREKDLTKNFLLNYFITDVYYENFPYVYLKEWQAVADMESVNKLMDIVQQLAIQGVANSGTSVVKKINENLEMQNNYIIDLSEEIQKLLSCPQGP